jgi:hypothetical protein
LVEIDASAYALNQECLRRQSIASLSV